MGSCSQQGEAGTLCSGPTLGCEGGDGAESIMRNAGLEEAQVGIKIAGRNINNLRYADAPRSRERAWVVLTPAQEMTQQPGQGFCAAARMGQRGRAIAPEPGLRDTNHVHFCKTALALRGVWILLKANGPVSGALWRACGPAPS